MAPNKDEPPAIRVYTVCDESKYLIVRNVPALGCGDELLNLFASYGDIQECKPMDAEDCESFTDVYWIKFRLFSNARFAKRKLDEFVFLGNQLKVEYAPHFESLSDTKEKLGGRRKEVIARLNTGRSKMPTACKPDALDESLLVKNPLQNNCISQQTSSNHRLSGGSDHVSCIDNSSITSVSSNQDYFVSPSMNQTVQLVREKLDKIQSSSKQLEAWPAFKKARVDNRRRI